MRRSLFGLLSVLVIGGLLWAGQETRPVPGGLASSGQPANDADLVGCKYSQNTSSAAVATNPALLYHITFAEGAATNDFIVYDSTYIINGGTCNAGANCTRALGALNPGSTSLDSQRSFSPPVRFTRGIAIDATLPANGTDSRWTACYTEDTDL